MRRFVVRRQDRPVRRVSVAPLRGYVLASLTATVVAGSGCVEAPPLGDEESAVINGTSQPAGHAPWVTRQLGQSSEQYCHGVLIAPGWILTAGHCVDPLWALQQHGATSTVVTLDGQSRTIYPAVSGSPNQIYRHPSYRYSGPGLFESVDWDAALIRVPMFDLTALARPASLPTGGPSVGEVATIASTQLATGVPVPAGTVAVASYAVTATTNTPSCETSYGHFCTYSADGASTVPGDSGSGLIRGAGVGVGSDPQVLGVDSYGRDAAPLEEHWTNVDRLRPWILETFRTARRPNTALSYPTTTCRTAPPRWGRLSPRRRIDMAEIFPEFDSTSVTRTSIAQHPSTGASFNVFEEWMRTLGGAGADIRWSVGDFDSDGDQDLMTVWNDGGNNHLTMWKSSGASFVAAEWGLPPSMGGWMSSTQWVPGDFNGDGRTDLIAAWDHGGRTTLSLFLSNGSSFGGLYHARVQDGAWAANTKFMVGDFNGDGRDDVLTAERSVTGTTVGTRLWLRPAFFNAATQRWELQGKTEWKPQHGGWDDAMVWMAGNFDGAGNADVMSIWNDGGAATFTMYPANGSVGGTQTHWARRDGQWSTTHRWAVGDVDGDGLDDVIAAWNDVGNTTLTVRRSLANALSAQVHWAEKRVAWQPATIWCAGAFDGT